MHINYILYLYIFIGNISLLKCNSLDFICFTSLDKFLNFINENNKCIAYTIIQYITDFFFTYNYRVISLHFCFETNTYFFSTTLNNNFNLTYWWLIFWSDQYGNLYYFWNHKIYIALYKNLVIGCVVSISLLTILYFLSAQSGTKSDFSVSSFMPQDANSAFTPLEAPVLSGKTEVELFVDKPFSDMLLAVEPRNFDIPNIEMESTLLETIGEISTVGTLIAVAGLTAVQQTNSRSQVPEPSENFISALLEQFTASAPVDVVQENLKAEAAAMLQAYSLQNANNSRQFMRIWNLRSTHLFDISGIIHPEWKNILKNQENSENIKALISRVQRVSLSEIRSNYHFVHRTIHLHMHNQVWNSELQFKYDCWMYWVWFMIESIK